MKKPTIYVVFRSDELTVERAYRLSESTQQKDTCFAQIDGGIFVVKLGGWDDKIPCAGFFTRIEADTFISQQGGVAAKAYAKKH
ncbi:hypothetical protein ACFL04_02555 [Patescibacteria group bacterium]